MEKCEAVRVLEERAAAKAAAEVAEKAGTDLLDWVLQAVKNVMENLNLTAEQAVDVFQLPDEDWKEILSRLSYSNRLHQPQIPCSGAAKVGNCL